MVGWAEYQHNVLMFSVLLKATDGAGEFLVYIVSYNYKTKVEGEGEIKFCPKPNDAMSWVSGLGYQLLKGYKWFIR